jgi:gluconate 5-dehydrogenase
MRINLDASFFLPQRLAPAMIAKGWGGSSTSRRCNRCARFPNCAPYGASKGAIMQLTRAQAEAWSRHGICVNAIAPGFFPDGAHRRGASQIVTAGTRWRRRRSFGRNGELSDLIGTAIFPREPRVRLRHGTDHFRRRRIHRRLKRTRRG